MKRRFLMIIGGLIGIVFVGGVGCSASMPEIEQQAVATPVTETEPATPEPEIAKPTPTPMETPEAETTEEQPTEAQPDQPVVAAQGQFQDADSAHRGTGRAIIYQLPEGNIRLQFEDFSVTNGPDLHVLLATGSAPTNQDDLGDYLDLGSLKSIEGDQDYEIPSGTDLSQYQSVVIYCVPFHVVFAIAILDSGS